MSGTGILTTGVDAGKDFIGTNKNDQFIADNSVNGTVNSSVADTLDGGKGVDTFKLYDNATATKIGSLPTLKNIENVVIYDSKAGATGDLTKWDTVETLFLVREAAANTYTLGEKVTTVNVEDTTAATAPILKFNDAVAAATLGVNKVGTATTATTVTVDSVAAAALKTLTINASGKASNVALVNTAIETLNITGKANLTLGAGTSITAVKTVDGSKAEGNLTFSNTANMTSIKTGSGNDTVTVAFAVASGETINLGAGNDKLVAGASVDTSTTTVIDGGAGIDSLDAALVTSGNAGVFANFETLSLTTAADLDLALVNKSTFTTIAIDSAAAASTVRNVSTSQSLTVNDTAAGVLTTLLFKDVAGTADAYTINFNADNTAATTNAGTVVINGIETVTVNSVGKTGVTTNTIKLTDNALQTLTISGDKALNLSFAGTNGTAVTGATDTVNGIKMIDASALTGVFTIDTAAGTPTMNIANVGLTIKGGSANDSITLGQKATVDAGAGDDTIVTSAFGGTLTGGAGKDTFNIAASTLAAGEVTEAGGVVKVTITDLTAGDTIKFKDGAGAESFTKIQINVDGASNLDAALALASKDNGTASTIINWFQYANNTYIVENLAATTTAPDVGDIVVKINGLVDLTNSALVGVDLTIA